MRESFDESGATLAEAKQWLRARFEKGATCPCCHRYVKLYKRNLNGSMVYVLLLIDRFYRCNGPEEWLHVPSYIVENTMDNARRSAAVRGDWAKMTLWGLIEKKRGKRADGSRRLGYYRITELGRSFVRREVKVPACFYIYNSKPLPRLANEDITIDEALGKKFNYDEIMAEA